MVGDLCVGNVSNFSVSGECNCSYLSKEDLHLGKPGELCQASRKKGLQGSTIPGGLSSLRPYDSEKIKRRCRGKIFVMLSSVLST